MSTELPDNSITTAGKIELPFEELWVIVDMASRKEKLEILIKLITQIVIENEGNKEFFQHVEERLEAETTRFMEEICNVNG